MKEITKNFTYTFNHKLKTNPPLNTKQQKLDISFENINQLKHQRLSNKNNSSTFLQPDVKNYQFKPKLENSEFLTKGIEAKKKNQIFKKQIIKNNSCNNNSYISSKQNFKNIDLHNIYVILNKQPSEQHQPLKNRNKKHLKTYTDQTKIFTEYDISQQLGKQISQQIKTIQQAFHQFIINNFKEMFQTNICPNQYYFKLIQLFKKISQQCFFFSSLFTRIEEICAPLKPSLQYKPKETQMQLQFLVKENQKLKMEIKELGAQSGSIWIPCQKLYCLIEDNRKLKSIALKKKDQLNKLQIRQQRIMKLIFELRKKGIDIDEIYNQTVRVGQQFSQSQISSNYYQ